MSWKKIDLNEHKKVKSVLSSRMHEPHEHIYRIYGRLKGSGRFRPFDENESEFVKNLIYAPMYKARDGEKLVEKVKNMNLDNPKFEFIIKRAN
jgi:hypothetical protein